MTSSVIGALRVNLGIDTAAFSDGLKKAQSSLAQAGTSLQKTGQMLTTRVTAPLVAAAGAIGVGVGRMAGSLSELGAQANIAGTSVEQFQKWAYAAKSVGIEQEKLADILKDTNDKVGDFLTTGGGQMADFFENIAPKVGLTADAFRGLSGADALQLYVSSLEKAGLSQAEMTFYMEALADEATALVPLLQDNGAEMGRLGEQASRFGLASADNVQSAKDFQEAMRGLTQAAQALGLAFVESGVLDVLTSLVEKVTGWVAALNEANPQLTRFTLIAGGIAAALGPALVAIGLLATAIAAVGLPVAAAVAGVAALTAGVVAFWPEIVRAKDAVVQFGADVIAAFQALPGKLAQVGRDVIDGLLAGLREKWEGVKAWFTGLADSIPAWVKERLGIHSPSTVFAEIGRNIMQGLSGGLEAMRGGVESDTQNFASSLATTFANVLTGAQDFRSALSNILAQVGDSLLQAGISNAFSTLGIPGFANGTRYAPGGVALVGERGPELMHVPRGARITPNDELGRLGGGSVNINVNVAGANGDAHVMKLVEQGVTQGLSLYDQTLPSRVAGISRDPRRRS